MDALSRHGSDFEDLDVVRCYAFRPPYPDALLARLIDLAHDRATAVDLGCGPGKLTRHLSDAFDRVEAVDPSKAMLDEARRHAAGRNIRWINAPAEEAELCGPYDLAVSGAAIHWMAPEIIMPILARSLTTQGPLALVEGDGPSEAGWLESYRAVLIRWVERSGRAWNDAAHRELVTAHETWFDLEGEESFSGKVRQPLDDLIECEHSRATWARSRMGQDADAFDEDLRAALTPFLEDRLLTYETRTTLKWGRPRTTPRA